MARADSARIGNLRREHRAAHRQIRRLGGKRQGGGEEEIGSPDRRITYERWFAIAVGQMGMRPDDFDDITPARFIYAWLGWMEREQSRMRQAWERERWAVWILTSIQMERKDRQPMTQRFPLPWEAAPVAEPVELSMAERVDRVNKILKVIEDET